MLKCFFSLSVFFSYYSLLNVWYNLLFFVKCAINRCCTCPHAQFQVHSHTENLMMTPHQPRANCQPPHTLPVSEKSCGFVEVHRGGRHYHTATKAEEMQFDIPSHTSLPCRIPVRNQVKSETVCQVVVKKCSNTVYHWSNGCSLPVWMLSSSACKLGILCNTSLRFYSQVGGLFTEKWCRSCKEICCLPESHYNNLNIGWHKDLRHFLFTGHILTIAAWVKLMKENK